MGRSWESKYHKREKRKMDRRSEKRKNKNNDDLFNLDYYDLKGLTFKDKIQIMLSAAWVINAWYEKVIFSVLVFLGVWKIINFVF